MEAYRVTSPPRFSFPVKRFSSVSWVYDGAICPRSQARINRAIQATSLSVEVALHQVSNLEEPMSKGKSGQYEARLLIGLVLASRAWRVRWLCSLATARSLR